MTKRMYAVEEFSDIYRQTFIRFVTEDKEKAKQLVEEANKALQYGVCTVNETSILCADNEFTIPFWFHVDRMSHEILETGVGEMDEEDKLEFDEHEVVLLIKAETYEQAVEMVKEKLEQL